MLGMLGNARSFGKIAVHFPSCIGGALTLAVSIAGLKATQLLQLLAVEFRER